MISAYPSTIILSFLLDHKPKQLRDCPSRLCFLWSIHYDVVNWNYVFMSMVVCLEIYWIKGSYNLGKALWLHSNEPFNFIVDGGVNRFI